MDTLETYRLYFIGNNKTKEYNIKNKFENENIQIELYEYSENYKPTKQLKSTKDKFKITHDTNNIKLVFQQPIDKLKFYVEIKKGSDQ